MTKNGDSGFLRVRLVVESHLGTVEGRFRLPWCLPAVRDAWGSLSVAPRTFELPTTAPDFR